MAEEKYEWLKKNNYELLLIFAEACHDKPLAIAWLRKNDLDIFLHLATIIKQFRDGQTFDYHKLHF